MTPLMRCVDGLVRTGSVDVRWFVNMWGMTHWYMTHGCVRRDWLMCETRLGHVWDMTHPYVRHDSLIRETWLALICETWLLDDRWLADMWDMSHWYVRHESLIWETWRIDMWDTTWSYMRHDSLACETRRTTPLVRCVDDFSTNWYRWWEMTCCCYLRHDSFHELSPLMRDDSLICETWLVNMWDMTRGCVRHDSLICETWLVDMWDVRSGTVDGSAPLFSLWEMTCWCDVTCLIDMWDMTRWYVRHDSLICETWLLIPSCCV